MPAEGTALLTIELICTHYVPVKKRAVYRWISAGDFPRAEVVIGGKSHFWRRETIEAWIASKVEERRQ
jgi:predicted DNA-binding transcriptional regulator AlpA